MPLRTDTNRGGLVPLASGWRVGFQRTGYTVDDYLDLGELVEEDDGEDDARSR